MTSLLLLTVVPMDKGVERGHRYLYRLPVDAGCQIAGNISSSRTEADGSSGSTNMFSRASTRSRTSSVARFWIGNRLARSLVSARYGKSLPALEARSWPTPSGCAAELIVEGAAYTNAVLYYDRKNKPVTARLEAMHNGEPITLQLW